MDFRKSAGKQALAVLGAAALIGIAWSVVGGTVRLRWLVNRGAPPASPEASAEAAEEIRAMGVEVRGDLLDLFRRSYSGDAAIVRARKAWVASVLLGHPFFARSEIERGLEAPDPATRRAAVFSLMNGREDAPSFVETLGAVLHQGRVPRSRPTPDAWDPEPGIPVLIEWLADRDAVDAHLAARLLGQVPPEPRVKEALLATVEEVKVILAEGADPDLQIRKLAVQESLQGLLPYARDDGEVVGRLCDVLRWIVENGKEELGFDIGMVVTSVLEVSRGRGVDWELIALVSRSPNRLLRQRLAGTLGDLQGPRVVEILSRLCGGLKGEDGYRGDENLYVRRSAMSSLMKRQDPEVNGMASYLVEDSNIFVRAEALKTVGELHRIDPRGSEANLPLLVHCLAEPWPGTPGDSSTYPPGLMAAAETDVVMWATLSLFMIAKLHPGYPVEAMSFDQELRRKVSESLAKDPERRGEVVAEWRKTVETRADGDRVPFLAMHLEDRDPDNVVRAMRELKRITGDATGFPPRALEITGDDTDARNAVREWMKTDRAATLTHWKR